MTNLPYTCRISAVLTGACLCTVKGKTADDISSLEYCDKSINRPPVLAHVNWTKIDSPYGFCPMPNLYFKGADIAVVIATSAQCHDFFVSTSVRKSYINTSSECALRSVR